MLRRGLRLTRHLRPSTAQRCTLSTDTLTPYEDTLTSYEETHTIVTKTIEEAQAEYLLAGNSLPWANVQLMQSYYSSIQEISHLSWPISIALGTIAIRIAFFPIVISQQKMGQRLQLHAPKLKEMQEELMACYQTGDTVKSREKSMQIADYKRVHNLSFFNFFKFILVQGPTFMTVFFALKSDYLPIIHPELHSAGYLGFTDLTVPDPTYMLPTINSSLIYMSLASTSHDPNMHPAFLTLLKVFKYGLPCIVFFAGTNLPAVNELFFSLVEIQLIRYF